MPGWPTVDRAADHDLVEALRRADPDAPATLFDSYGERLHDYAYCLTGEPDLSADAVHDALVSAHGWIERLKEPGRLRAWLYALTRSQVGARLAHRGTPPQGPPLPDPDEQPDPELADLVHETLGELAGLDREVLELSLRHGLTPSEVGAVLALTSRQAAARLARARDHLEIAVAAVVLARTGRAHCPDLSAMVDSWEGPLTPLLRRRLSGHIGGCEVCGERRRGQVDGRRLLDLVPVGYPPLSLRRRVIETCVSPGRDQARTLIVERGEGFDRAGFPVAGERRSRRRRPLRLAPVVLAGACVLAATGAVVVINGGEAADKTSLRFAPATPVTSDAPPAVPSAYDESPEPVPDQDGVTPSPEPSPSASRRSGQDGRPAAARPTTRPTTRPATLPTAPPRRAPARNTRRPAPVPRLGASCPKAIDGVAQIGLSARGAAVSWSAAASQGLEVSPASGSIKAGGSVRIQVTVTEPEDEGDGRVSFTSNGGTSACTLTWEGRQPDDAGPPDHDPVPTPTESTAIPTGMASSGTDDMNRE
ncbi:RNA polymerase sigma factor [Nonomuraea coxensis DSM 45129]|uniref:RNA polymerase sigma factor n=1 Tax=Nonomuraea coxensis DSM 45129 TaxID=1122611 RepID=A0ABX8U9A3_9ACTN|nr:sigma-70 family RNA polymerase sigma factor [Nonomuraea coxensis]QYC44357.1 RNA polymerase sigma factor [Nonomuraea coxensis DSM 45129]